MTLSCAHYENVVLYGPDQAGLAESWSSFLRMGLSAAPYEAGTSGLPCCPSMLWQIRLPLVSTKSVNGALVAPKTPANSLTCS